MDQSVMDEKNSVASMMKYLVGGEENMAPAGVVALEVVKRRPGGITFGPITFHVWPGEIFGVLGLAQTGRTLLLKMVAGVVSTDGGNVFINGVDVRRRPLTVSVVTHDFPFLETTSGFLKCTITQ